MKKRKSSKCNLSAKADKADSVSINSRQSEKLITRKFNGPAGADSHLRVALKAQAFSEISNHANQFLDVEICGVLVGLACCDDEGPFVQVEAIIRGESTKKGTTSVTFTHETWDKIHHTLETRYPKLQIVGWYHTHPGFGVEFSEMDIFIHKNFFPNPTQIALVYDPLGGKTAVCVNGDDGIRYLSKIWIDGREKSLDVPESADKGKTASGNEGDVRISSHSLESMQRQIRSINKAIDDMQNRVTSYIYMLVTVIALSFVTWIGFSIFDSYQRKFVPPKLKQFTDVPVQIGDSQVLLGVSIESWDIPDEVNPIHAFQKEMNELIIKAIAEGDSEAADKTESQLSHEKKKKKRWWLLALSLGLLSFCISAVCIFLLRRRSKRRKVSK